MDSNIGLLFLVVPGFLAFKLYQTLTSSSEKYSDFEKTILSMIFNVFILLGNMVFLIVNYACFKPLSYKALLLKFDDVGFLLYYGALTLVMCVVVAVAWDKLYKSTLSLINKYRERGGRNKLLEKSSVFSNLFDDGENHLVSVKKGDREIAFGMLRRMEYSPGNNLELNFEGLKKWPEYRDGMEKHKEIKSIYYDADRDLTITEYDHSSYI